MIKPGVMVHVPDPCIQQAKGLRNSGVILRQYERRGWKEGREWNKEIIKKHNLSFLGGNPNWYLREKGKT